MANSSDMQDTPYIRLDIYYTYHIIEHIGLSSRNKERKREPVAPHDRGEEENDGGNSRAVGIGRLGVSGVPLRSGAPGASGSGKHQRAPAGGIGGHAAVD